MTKRQAEKPIEWDSMVHGDLGCGCGNVTDFLPLDDRGDGSDYYLCEKCGLVYRDIS